MRTSLGAESTNTRSLNVRSLIRLMRPIQWTKNIFVFAGVLFSKSFDEPGVFFIACLAAISFCLISSSIYVINDIMDCDIDRHHPKKKYRPIASGLVKIPAAWTFSLMLGFTGLSIALAVGYEALLIVFSYLILNIIYSVKLKHVVIVDVFCISAGFMLRILVGTVGIGIPPSKWMMLCGLMITLFLGFAKRRAELAAIENDEREKHRHVLKLYRTSFLDNIITICATSVIISYSLYTMSPDTLRIHRTDNLIYTVPFVMYALFRYIFNLHHSNSAGDPSTDLFKDKHIFVAVLGWLITSVYFITYYKA